jgi:hypothetical protein
MRMMIPRRALAVACLMTAALIPATAQNGQNYNVKTMNFDLWCQETQHLPPERCDKRTPDDEKTFEAYRDQVERYEVPYLQQQQRDLTLNRDIIHNDPISHPLPQDPQRQDQSPTEQPKTPSP